MKRKNTLPGTAVSRFTPAFSLVEMLMALLVASLLLAALAPVMTKRLGDENITVAGSLRNFTVSPCVHINDTLADTDNATCTIPANVHLMSAIIASGGGGGGGAADKVFDARDIEGGFIDGGISTVPVRSTGTYSVCDSGAIEDNTYKTRDYVITKDMQDIWVEIVGSGAGGGGGNTNLAGHPGQQADCGNWGIYIAPEYNGAEKPFGVCVSKYNMGDTPGTQTLLQTYSKVVPVGTNEAATCSANKNCCYQGQTLVSDCTNVNGDYGGCNRTVCQWNAADKVCNNWAPYGSSGPKARLPKASEITAWFTNINYTTVGKGNNGLQLCSSIVTSGTVMAQCSDAYNTNLNRQRCYFGLDTYCLPRYYWSGNECKLPTDTSIVTHCAYNAHSSAGGGCTGFDERMPSSVRCVVDKYYEAGKENNFKAYHGAGAHPALYGKMKIPDEVLKRAFEPDENGKVADTVILRLIAGSGGRGSWGYGNDKEKGENGCYAQQGSPSSVLLFRKIGSSNDPLWYFQVMRGNQGAAATHTKNGDINTVILVDSNISWSDYKNGIIPEKPNATNCAYFNKYDSRYNNWSDTSIICSAIPDATVLSGTPADEDGNGGVAYWRGALGTKAAYKNDGTNGTDAPSYGSGGAGATCIEGATRLTPKCGNGGNGGPGAARFTYKRSYPGSAGGGGGAGTVAHLVNLQVSPGNVIKIQAGKRGMGGYGGASPRSGLDGGDSFIELPNGTKYTVTGGKGGTSATSATIPATGEVQDSNYSKAGKGGEGGTISDTIKSRTTNPLNKDEYYPNSTSDINNAKGKDGIENADKHALKSTGGNGGINNKISLTGIGNSNNRIPCGGFSTTSVMINNKAYECKVSDYRPLALSRILNENDITQSIKSTFALGSTGGGGGGWNNDAYPSASSGADGMGGYVILYFE